MAYVALGRCEELKDIYIKGKVDPEGIHASPEALEETERLQSIFDLRVEAKKEHSTNFWKISYLNVRSLKCHEKDVAIDNFLMNSDLFALGETHLEPQETICFPGYKEYFASYGKGKGVSVFSRMDCTNRPVVNSVASSLFSGIHFRTTDFDAIFLYWSSNCNAMEVSEILDLLDTWIIEGRPTTIIGDVNMNFSKDCILNKFLEKKGFQQLVNVATCETGNLIDHLYINQPIKSTHFSFETCSAYYSDHDIITLYIPK